LEKGETKLINEEHDRRNPTTEKRERRDQRSTRTERSANRGVRSAADEGVAADRRAGKAAGEK
jgi:hypothetical protein